jgi:hypothetical protein
MRLVFFLAVLALALTACWRESVPRYDDPRARPPVDASVPPDAPDAGR